VSSVREARRAVRRGDPDAALVLLWNELEPARLSGDRRRLAAVADLAGRIAAGGGEADRREAERLVEQVQEYVAASDADVAATARIDADVVAGGMAELPREAEQRRPVPAPAPEPQDEPDGSARGNRIGTLIWLVVFGAIVLLNALRGAGE
jgi:hypothetical protein